MCEARHAAITVFAPPAAGGLLDYCANFEADYEIDQVAADRSW